jgi:hypothetical protein
MSSADNLPAPALPAARAARRRWLAAKVRVRRDGSDVIDVRPVWLRRVCFVGAVICIAGCTVAAVLLRDGSGAQTFERSDQVGVFLIGLLAAAGLMVLARPRLRADATGLWVRNIFGTHQVPWDLVRAVRFPEKAPWAALELPGEEMLSIVALQAIDGDRAVRALQALRAMHERYAGPAA